MKWIRLVIGIGCAVSVVLSSVAYANDNLTPYEIMERMKQTYLEFSAYQDSGTVITIMDLGISKQTITKPFKIAFKRHDFFKFEWVDTMFGGQKDHHILWSAKPHQADRKVFL